MGFLGVTDHVPDTLRGPAPHVTMTLVTYVLDRVHDTSDARCVVLFLHGGQQENLEPVEKKHASWWRVNAMAKRVGAFDGTAVTYVIRFSARGWNDPAAPSPVGDARAALAELREVHPGLPIVLVGHSMGGRTACRVADDKGVIGVVALAPWLPEGEPVAGVADRDVRILHGTRDRWTSAPLSKAWAEEARSVAASVEWTSLAGVGHFMFRRVSTWNRFVTDSVAEIRRRGTM